LTPLATKEFVLNYAMNRWQLNFKKNVGPTSDSIRQCSPQSLEQWKAYYYTNVRSHAHITQLGKILSQRINEDLPGERRFHPDLLGSINEDDCIEYMHNIVINRTYDGYMKEHGR
jgi:hypothetical protein